MKLKKQPPGAGSPGAGSSNLHVFIFVAALACFLLLRQSPQYLVSVERMRTFSWADEIASRRALQQDEEDLGSSAEEDAALESSALSSSSSSSSSVSAEAAKEVAVRRLTEDQKSKLELQLLERAVTSRLEEERLNSLLLETRHVVVGAMAVDKLPPDGERDLLFKENFKRELDSLVLRWADEFKQVQDARDSSTADESLKKLAEWEVRWEEHELDRMLMDAKVKLGFDTLTGKRSFLSLSPSQLRPVSLSSSGSALISSDAVIRRPLASEAGGNGTSAQIGDSGALGGSGASGAAAGGASGGDSSSDSAKDKEDSAAAGGALGEGDDDFGVDGEVPRRIAIPTAVNLQGESESEELLATLQSLETTAMQWTEKSKKTVIVLGERVYVGRDLKVYKWAFSRVGFNVKMGSSSTGRMSTKLLAGGDWSVLLCLALNTEHCFTSTALDRTKKFQRINRVQGLRRVLWSKDSFCETVSASARGLPAFRRYIFDCWIFPREYAQAAQYAAKHPKMQFIVKPLSMGGGMGISVVDGERGLHKVRHKTQIVQNYLHNPMLIKGKKWDLRTYVLVTSVLPLRAYVYSRGLVRFASQAYDPKAKHGGKRTQFLTNTSVNKHYVRKGNVTDITWAFENLKQHLDQKTPTYTRLLSRMQAAISIVLLSAERSWRRYFDDLTGEQCNNCYQLMGVDLIVDDNLQPRVIEVNGQPSMQLTKSEEDHYTTTKKNMIRDLVSLVYNEDRVASDLAKELATFDRDSVAQLQTHDLEYLLEYKREKQSMGGWLPVYPSHRHHALHTEFFKFQKNPPAEESRLLLHQVLGWMEQDLFDAGGPKPREDRNKDDSDDDDGPEISDEAIEDDDGEEEEGAPVEAEGVDSESD